MSRIGREIRRIREERDLNQAQLAVMIGTGPAAISRIENGRQIPSMVTLQKLADALGVGVEDFLPKDQARLPLDSEERSRAAQESFVHLVDLLDDEQLVALREWLKDERILLGFAHHDHPGNQPIRDQFAKAVKRLMTATLELASRGYGREERGRQKEELLHEVER